MSAHFFKRMQMIIMSTLIVTSVLALRSVVLAREELRFNPIITHDEITIEQEKGYWKLPGGTHAQNSTLIRYQRYLISQGITDRELLRRASAILVHENEKLSFDRTHDNNLGFGICGRYVGVHYNTFKRTHPEEVTPEAQIKWCGDRFIASLDKYKHKTEKKKVQMPDGRWISTTDRDFRVWVHNNCPACAYAGVNTTHLDPPYFQRVQFSYEKLSLF